MGSPYWAKMSDFHPSVSAGSGNRDGAVRKRRDPLADTHQIKCPQERNSRTLRSGAIADLRFDLLGQESKPARNEPGLVCLSLPKSAEWTTGAANPVCTCAGRGERFFQPPPQVVQGFTSKDENYVCYRFVTECSVTTNHYKKAITRISGLRRFESWVYKSCDPFAFHNLHTHPPFPSRSPETER